MKQQIKSFSENKLTSLTALALAILALGLSPSASAMGRSPASSTPSSSVDHTDYEGGSTGGPSISEPFFVNVVDKNYTAKQEANLEKAVRVAEMILNSEEFKQRVFGHKYQGKTQYVQNEGLSNEQVYQKIMTGIESYDSTADREMDLNVSMYYTSKGVIGYTYSGGSTVYTNSRFHNSFKPYQIAGNLVHEWTHKLGFGHDYKSTARRPYSVPYAVGNIVVEIGKRLYNQE